MGMISQRWTIDNGLVAVQLLSRPTICIWLGASSQSRNAHGGEEVVTGTFVYSEQLQATSIKPAQGCASIERPLIFRRIDFPRVGMQKDVWAVRRIVGSPCTAGQAEPNAGEQLDSLKPRRGIVFRTGVEQTKTKTLRKIDS